MCNGDQIEVHIARIYEVLDVYAIVNACKYHWLFDLYPCGYQTLCILGFHLLDQFGNLLRHFIDLLGK